MATVPWLRMTAINQNELFDGVGSNFEKKGSGIGTRVVERKVSDGEQPFASIGRCVAGGTLPPDNNRLSDMKTGTQLRNVGFWTESGPV